MEASMLAMGALLLVPQLCLLVIGRAARRNERVGRNCLLLVALLGILASAIEVM